MPSSTSTDRSSSVASSAHSVYSSDGSAATPPAASSAEHTPKKKSYAYADQQITPPRDKKNEGRGPRTPSSTASTGTRESNTRRGQHDPLLPTTPKKTHTATAASVAGAGAGTTGRGLGGGLSSLAASTISGNERDEGGSRSESRSHSESRRRSQSRENSGLASQRPDAKRSGSGVKKDGPPTTTTAGAKGERSLLSRGVVVGKGKLDGIAINASNFSKATEASKRKQQSAMAPPSPLTNMTATTAQKRVNSSTSMNRSAVAAAAVAGRASSNKRVNGSSEVVVAGENGVTNTISRKRRSTSHVKETAALMAGGASAERSQSGRRQQTDESRRPIVRAERMGRPTITSIPTRRTLSSSAKEKEQQQHQQERSNKTKAVTTVRNVGDGEQHHYTYNAPTSPRQGGYPSATVEASFAPVAEELSRNGETREQLRATAAPFAHVYAHSSSIHHPPSQHLLPRQQIEVNHFTTANARVGAGAVAEGRPHNGPISSSPRSRPLSSSGLNGRLEGGAEGSTLIGAASGVQLSHANVTAVKNKITVLERKAAEKTTQEETLVAKVAHLEADCETVLGEISALRSDEHELLLRVIEARLLNDALAAQHAETTRATQAARRRLRSEHGNATVRSFTYSHLKAIAQQKSEEVAELESARESVEAQIAAIEADAYLLEEDIQRRAREASEARNKVEQQGARLGAIVDSVSQALAFA